MVYNSIFSLFLNLILVVVLLSLSKEIYLHGWSDVKFYTTTFQKKSMTSKTSFLSHKSPCLPLKIFKLFNKREVPSNNGGKTVVNFPHSFRETLSACAFGRNNKSLKLLRYKILIHLTTWMLDSFVNLSWDFYIYIQLEEVICSRLRLHIAVRNHS